MTRLIVGLGNPGSTYAKTRHNMGFMVLDRLAEKWKIKADQELFQSRVGQGNVHGVPVGIFYPQTFMNSAGEAVVGLFQHWKLDPSLLLVVFDDVYLPLGWLRFREKGSEGGHQGMASIIQAMGTEAIPRLRIGIGPGPGGDLKEFVLDRFGPSEKQPLEDALGRAVEACEVWISRGLSAAMNRFNQKITERK